MSSFLSLEAVVYMWYRLLWTQYFSKPWCCFLYVLVYSCLCICGFRTLVGRESWTSHCKRFLTHHPSSQGWASRCLVLCMFVCIVFVCLGLGASPFSFLLDLTLSIAGVLYCQSYVIIHQCSNACAQVDTLDTYAIHTCTPGEHCTVLAVPCLA